MLESKNTDTSVEAWYGDIPFPAEKRWGLRFIHRRGHGKRNQRGRDRPDGKAIVRKKLGDDGQKEVKDDADENAADESFHIFIG